MAKAPAIVLTTGFTPLDNHLEALAEDINKNYNQAMDGYFKTARTVHDALAYIDDKFLDGKERETQINAFFKQTLLNGDNGTVSKLRTIGSNFPVISEYKDHIPNNATAYYLVARMEDANAWLSKAVNQKDEDKQLTPETSITELRHLIATGSKSQKLISERKLRKAFVINISDDAIGGDDHKKLEVLIEQIDEISNVEIKDFKLFQKQLKKYDRLLQAEYNKIGRRLVREAIAEYKNRTASGLKGYKILKKMELSHRKPDVAGWDKDEIDIMLKAEQFAKILVELPLHSDITDDDILQMAIEKVGYMG